MTCLLIDADMLLFRVMSAAEIDVCLGADQWIRMAELNEVRDKFWEHVSDWQESFDGASYRLCFTSGSGFRKKLAPDYKANRIGTKKPVAYAVMKRELLDDPKSHLHDEIEADDWIGILASAHREAGEKYVVCSGDKDLDQIQGMHYWPFGLKKEETSHLFVMERLQDHLDFQEDIPKATKWHVDETHATQQFYKQTLIGDSTDNIPGCPGVGSVGATKLVESFDLSEPVDCWEQIVRQFEKSLKKKSDVREAAEVALTQARLVRILSHTEYDAKTSTVDLWKPPTLRF